MKQSRGRGDRGVHWRAREKQDNPEMPPAEPATSMFTLEFHLSPALETKFLACLVNPAIPGYGQREMGWPTAWWGPPKDTGFLGVGHSCCGAPNDVAVEGDL